MGKILEILGKLVPGFQWLGVINSAGGLMVAGLAAWWLLGHRDETLCLNYLELAGLVGIGTAGMELNRRSQPGA